MLNKKQDYIFCLDFKVRDYECDIQGIVNNSVYQNYLEHTRHEFMQELGFNFVKLTNENILPVVYRIEIDYKKSLKPGDEFISCLNIEHEGNLKLVFYQEIIRKSDKQPIIKAKVTTVVLKNGKPVKPDNFLRKINKLL
jgi:acyl-CoA thioester hydrolase